MDKYEYLVLINGEYFPSKHGNAAMHLANKMANSCLVYDSNGRLADYADKNKTTGEIFHPQIAGIRNPNRKYAEILSALNEKENRLFLSKILRNIMRNPSLVLQSSGLEADEYVRYVKGDGFCFENGCVIGASVLDTVERLITKDWAKKSDWFVKELSEIRKDSENERIC